MLYGGWEKGKEIMDEVIAHNFKYPMYFHVARLLYYFRKEEFDRALIESNQLEIPNFFWPPMLRASLLGQMNQFEEARQNIILLRKLKANFEDRARYLISQFVKEKDLLEKILDGLRKAGMTVPAA